jgi:hypothetical protein
MIFGLALLLAVQVDLDPALRFADPARCEPGPALTAILGQMTRLDPVTFEAGPPGPITVPGVAQPIAARFRRDRTVEENVDIRDVTVEIDLNGRWHGLRVVRLVRHFGEESDNSSIGIYFAEPPERVRRVLRRAGFRLGDIGMWREVEGIDGIGMVVTVARVEDGAALICAVG